METKQINSAETYHLSRFQINTFKDKGAIYLPEVENNENIKLLGPVITNAVEKFTVEKRSLKKRDTYGKAFLQVMNLWQRDEAVKEFTLKKKFAQIAAKLLNVDKVRIYHDQALFKEAGGGATPWHQDQYYWPLNTLNTVTMWMPLVDIDPSMGILTFAEGSHRDGLVKNIPISDESESLLEDYINEKGYNIFMPPAMKAGDATFHYGYTLHKAPGNSSPKMREVMTIIYFADGARVTTPINEAQENDRQSWLDGTEAGQMAASRLNPIV